jgi:hypothetical protein
MKPLTEIIKAEQNPESLQVLLQRNSGSGSEVSIYSGPLTDSCLVKSVAVIKKSFPSLPISFYDILIDRIQANHFSNTRLIDAVNHVIDNCHYPTPTIADFISFDQKYKVFSYDEMLKKLDEMGGDRKIWDLYKSVKLPGLPKPVWVHVNDIAKYNIKSE